MATWDSADLLARCRDEAQEPSAGTATTDAQWYSLLTASQHRVYRLFAQHVPHVLVGAPVALSTADGGATYTFPSSVYPLGYAEVREGTDGRVLWSGPNESWVADFVFEGDALRIPNGQTRTFSSGLYARYVTTPGTIDASTEPTLTPDWARILLVYDAVKTWASQGGLRDPSTWAQKFQHEWSGDPAVAGDVGICGALKTQIRRPGRDAMRQRRWL